LSWAIIQRHHGRIEIHSTVGQGTTFRVILPIDRIEPGETPPDTPSCIESAS
jgi:two-component system NtrC family sensor kinase